MNRVNLTGNLTRDAELRTTQNGTKVCDIAMAVNDRWQNRQTGQWEDRPNYVDCTMFGESAERWAPKLTSGTKVGVDGRLHWSSWGSGDQKKSKLDVTVEKIEILHQKQQPEQPTTYSDEDIPF